MAVKNTAQVVIGGKIITLGGYESEEYFHKVASYINKKIAELSEMPGYTRQPVETKHTLLSLNVTDDYFKAKDQVEKLERDLENKEKEISKNIAAYKAGGKGRQTKVIYCFDCDDYNTKQEDAFFLEKVRQYCAEQKYDFVWFCKDIERVYTGKKVNAVDKKKKSY